jgi:multiple sugar transport system permease protein
MGLLGLAGLLAGAVVMLVPFVWMALTSFKTLVETMQVPITWLPGQFRLENYAEVLLKMDFQRYYLNTVIMTLAVDAAQLLTCATAAYAFAKMRFPGRDALFFILLSILMIPAQMTLLPRYQLMTRIGWQNTLQGLIVPMIPSAYGVFFLRQFFLALPGDLNDAARIDGCGHVRTFALIDAPLCKSALIAYGVINTLWAWNELLWPLVITNSDSMKVLSLAMAAMQGEHATKYHTLMAASVMATLPMILLFLVAQKHYVEGIVFTGIKA